MTMFGDMAFKVLKLKIKLLATVMSNSLRPLGLYLTRLPQPMEFSRQEYWSELPCPYPGPGIEPSSSALPADSLPSEPPGKPISSVQSLSRVQLFVTPWTTARQPSLSITNSRSLPKPMSTVLVMPSNHLILCRPLLLLPSVPPSIKVFSDESAFASGGQTTGVSASTSVLPMNTQD